MDTEGNEFARKILRCIAQLERQRRRYLDDHLRDTRLRGPMFMIISFLDREPGSIQDDLSTYLGIDKSGITRLCHRLEELGYIRREQSQKDRRQNKLYLTEDGRALLPVIRSRQQDWRNIITAGMDEDDRRQLLRFLEHMLENALQGQ